MDIVANTRAARQALSARIIMSTRIHSQRELSDELAARGVVVTQATLSRDLREMRAMKVREAGGAQVYTLPEAGAPGQNRLEDGGDPRARVTQRLARLSAELLVSLAHARGDLVIKTQPGAAQLLAAAIDDAMLPGVMGTIAGDDTILLSTAEELTAAAIAEQLVSLSGSDSADLHSEARPLGGDA